MSLLERQKGHMATVADSQRVLYENRSRGDHGGAARFRQDSVDFQKKAARRRRGGLESSSVLNLRIALL